MKCLIIWISSLVLIGVILDVCYGAEIEDETSKIQKTIVHLLSKGLPKHKIKPWPRHPLLKDTSQLLELSSAINAASQAKDVPPALLIATGFREGSFKPGSEGDLGELSMFQMMPATAREAQLLEPRCTLDTVEGSAMCSATWLRHWADKCGNWRGSLAIYATGKSCNPKHNERVEWLTADRLGIAKKLHKRFWAN